MKDAVGYLCLTILVILFVGQDPLIDRIGRQPSYCQPSAAR
ncbi:hypothetical protein [Pseudomonas sp. F(2018)]|nr:hypothetical protein [Pseudomonas sp. F(2018)]